MFRGLVDVAEEGLRFLAEKLKVDVEDYCDLETTADGHVVAKDSSMGTVFRYDGFRSLISHKEFMDFCDSLSQGLETYMGQRGHQIQIVFRRDDNPDDEVMRYMGPAYESCNAIGMDMSDILNERRGVMNDYCMDEQVYIVLWTRPSVLDPAELKMNREETRELIQRYKFPPMKDAQDFLRPNRFLVDRHIAFVGHFNQMIVNLQGSITQLHAREGLCVGKRFLYRNTTPANWAPILLGDPMFIRWKEKQGKDISALSYPRLDHQLFSSPAKIGGNDGTGDGGLTDARCVRFGDRLFAPVMVKIPPMRPMAFSALFSTLNKASANTDRGSKPLPWAISFMLTGDGLKGTFMRMFFGGIMSLGSDGNRNLVNAFRTMSEYARDGGTVTQMQIMACTWAPYGQEKELILRRSKLSTALANWGNCTVAEETGDAAEAVVTSAPGLSTYSIAPASAPPLKAAIPMLPLARPASPFMRGQTVFRSLDGKLMPWESFSDEQNTWLTLWFGGPGVGKSMQANRTNLDLSFMGGNKRLPWLGVLDMGISSTGLIQLIQDSLEPEFKHLAAYIRPQNTEEYSVNVCGDTQLGCRFPLPDELEFKVNFLTMLATPASRDKPHRYMPQFVSRVIHETYRRLSDKEERGQPKPYVPSHSPEVDDAIARHGIEVTEATKWYQIVDALFDCGEYYLAAVAQRFAVPILMDFLTVASEQDIQKDFVTAVDEGMPVTDEFNIMVSAAIDHYKMFSGYTRFDTGESRVMAIDLQDVVVRGTSAAAKHNGAIMYGAALHLFTSKINIHAEALDSIDKRYRPYHAKRVEELSEEYKRLFIDEYHNTGNNEHLRDGILVFGRESRKWGMEIVLASQLPQDFNEMAQIATTTVIMDSGNEKTRATIKSIFGLSDAEVAALKRYVHGPQPGIGATFLAKIRTKTAEMSQLFTSTVGGRELWALSTTLEDRALRARLTKELSPAIARELLAARFPGGCKTYVQQKKAEVKEGMGNDFVEEDVESSIIQTLARELISDWQRKSAAATV